MSSKKPQPKPRAKAPAPAAAPVSFARNILPLFRQQDIQHMAPMGVKLNSYSYMSTPSNAQTAYDYLSGAATPRMPMGGPYWSSAQLQLFNAWMTTGYNP